MKFFSTPFFLLALFTVVFTSCTEEVLVEFSINNKKDLVASASAPAEKDLLPVYQIDNDISAIAVDRCTPRTSITSRQWFLLKDGKVTDLAKDSSIIHLSFQESGLYGLMLRVNGEKEPATTHWLDVHVSKSQNLLSDELEESFGDVPGISAENFQFVHPRSNELVNDRSYDVLIDADIYQQDFDALTLKLNGRKQKSTFDASTGQISSSVRLKKGKNTLTLESDNFEVEQIVEYSTKKTPPPPPPPNDPPTDGGNDVAQENPSNNQASEGKTDDQQNQAAAQEVEENQENSNEKAKPANNPIGYSLNGVEPCLVDLGTEYTFTITPEFDIELDEMYIFTDLCGGLKLQLSSSEGTETSTEALTPGRNPISLIGLYPELTAGVTYTLKLTTLANVFGCSAPNAPKIKMLKSNCSQAQKLNNSAIAVDYKGKPAIFNLKYQYSN